MTKERLTITFQPLGRSMEVEKGASVLEAARNLGVKLEADCNGQGTCGSCRVRAVDPSPPPTEAERGLLDADELEDGVRLACMLTPQADTLVVGDLVMCDVDSLVESAGLNLEEFQHQLHTGGTKGPLIVRLATEGRAGTGCPPEGGSVQAMALRSGGRCRVALVATGLKDDVSAFHRGRIDAEELARRLEFVEGPLEPGDEKRLDIMAGILEEGLSRGTGVQAQGMYVKGLGALFFVDAGPAELGVQLIPKDLFLSQLGRRDRGDEQLVPEMTTGTGGGERGKQIEDREAQLVELVAEYGSSLRMLKADESVVVVVGPSRGPFGGSRASGLVLRARHRDISAFDRGRLDLDGFRQKVEVSER